MRWKDIGSVDCSIARTLSVIGDRWTMLVLRDAFLGVRRFEDFQNDLGLSRHLLTDRLATLVDHGILERRPYSEHRRRCSPGNQGGPPMTVPPCPTTR